MRVGRRRLFLLTAGLFFLGFVNAQRPFTGRSMTNDDRIMAITRDPELFSYAPGKAAIKEISDPSGEYRRFILPGHHFTSVAGEPQLPVYSRLVQVPSGSRVIVSLKDISTQRIALPAAENSKTEIFPSQPARTKNEVPEERVVVKNKTLYRSRNIISHDTVVISHEGYFRGSELINIAVYPAFYNPGEGYVDLISSMKLDISYQPDDSKGDSAFPPAGEKGGFSSDSYITGYSDRPVEMIIVTDSLFLKHLQPLLRWKHLKGIRTTVICKNPAPADSVYFDLKERIRNLYTQRLLEGNPPQYLMIVGDPAIIPTSRGTTNVTDLYYGEFDDEGDYIPELFTGRLPASDTTQLKGIVKKIIDYEKLNYSSTNDFWSHLLITAGNAPGYESYMNGQVNYINRNYLLADTTIDGTAWLSPYAQTKDDSLKILFNNGLALLNYTGHGEAAGFSDPTFKVTGVSQLTNTNRYPLIVANACRTAQINVTGCLGSAILNAQDKGAIGYIGCTNDSYWDEDFYWAIGPGTPDVDVTYELTGAGAFDRFFHTHNEAPGDWYYTMGQLLFSGNMAVSASTSSKKKYYWETYMLLGDPSLMPVAGRADTFDIAVPDTLPQALERLDFFSKPFSYAAISDFDTLWDARFVSPSGNISLQIPSGTKDSCLLVITGQNMVPYFKTIHFGNIKGAFLTKEMVVFDDSEGNNNNQPDYGERINLKVTIKNLGEGPSSYLTSNLSVASGHLTVESGSADIGILDPGQSFTINNLFIFSVSDAAEDGELASLLMEAGDNGTDYLFGIDMTLLAPSLKIISSVHDDSETGNSNFLPDKGETIRLNVKVMNEGSSSTSGTLNISTLPDYLIPAQSSLPTGLLEPGQTRTISFEAEISDGAISGTIIPYELNLTCGNYGATGIYTLSTGKTRETWEFNRFDVFPWIVHSPFPWTITSSSSYDNVLSARSAVLPDNSESILSIIVNNPERDTISFYSRVSTEAIYDELIFRIDSVKNFSLSGESPWARRDAILTPGIHYLEWVYKKDVSLSGGLDAVWIDQIRFPDISFLEADLCIDTVYVPPATVDPLNVTVSGRVINHGRNTLTSFPLAYRVNGNDPVNETFYLKLDPGDSLDVVFTSRCSLKKDVSNTISIIGMLPEDPYQKNDTASVTFTLTGFGEEPYSIEGLSVFPNPFTDHFNIFLNSVASGPAVFELVDGSGRVVMKQKYDLIPGENIFPVECRTLANGVYTLRMAISGKSSVTKVIKGNNK